MGDDAVAPLEVDAVARVVRLLCHVRIAVLALGIVSAIASGSANTLTLVMPLAIPFSYVPSRSWRRHGRVIARSGILISCDLITTSLVIFGIGSPELAAIYVCASVALIAVLTSARIASLIAFALSAVVVAAFSPEPGSWPVTTMAVLGAAAMVWVGATLGDALRRQLRAQRDLAEAQASRAALQERLRLARDLHDTVAADLSGTLLLSQSLAIRLASHPDQATRTLASQLVEACQRAHQDTRAALGELRSADPTNRATWVETVTGWSDRTGIACEVDVEPGALAGVRDSGRDLHLILLELLENVRKHSLATRVEVALRRVDDDVTLTVVNDGGCPTTPRTTPHQPDDEHFGLTGIAERAEHHGGSFASGPTPTGYRATVALPITRAEITTP